MEDKQGPETPGGYLTKGEYQAKLDYEDETIRIIKEGEGRFGEMSPEEIAAEVAEIKARKDSIMFAFKSDYPTANFQKKDFRTRKEWEQAEIEAQQLEGTGVTKEGFVDPFKATELESKFPPESREFMGRPLKQKDFTKIAKLQKQPLNIRLMKNFDQPLEDIALAKEGYNVQEIDVLKKARNRLTTGEEMHPNEALLREKEFLADEAGIDLDDLDELKLDIDWGDMTPEPMAFGGGVGSMFRRV
jgi:hypothetical protein